MPPQSQPPGSSRRRTLRPRRLPTRLGGQRTFAKVLEAATDLIEKHGLDYATTRRVARAAGLSVGAVYEYFPNKESIALRIGETWMQGIREAMAALHPERSGIRDLATFVARTLAGAVELYREPRGLLTVGVIMGAVPQLREAVRRHDEKMVQIMGEALRALGVTAPAAEIDGTVRTMQAMVRSILIASMHAPAADAAVMLSKMHIAAYAVLMPLLVPRGVEAAVPAVPSGRRRH